MMRDEHEYKDGGPEARKLLDAARDLAPRIRACADEIECGRRLPVPLVADLARAGFFRMCVPRKFGGDQADAATMIRVIEAIAEADGAAGWCVMIAATSGVLSAYLPDGTAQEIYGAAPDVVTGGVFAPLGKAVVSNGGYRVSGRWAFASGCEHCDWLMGGSMVLADGAPQLLANGLPNSRLMLFPAAEAQIIDTWNVSGLRGTGSHDMVVTDLFVPGERSVSLLTDPPRQPGPLYAFPVFGLLALGIAGVATGLARRAIDELVQLASAKTPSGSRRRLTDRGVIQMQVAQAEAALRSGRAFLFETVDRSWDAAVTTGTVTVKQRALLRLAATQATVNAASAVDWMYTAGGGTSIYADSPLQRCFRDIHVVTQHVMVAAPTYELAGRIFLGMDADTSML